MIDVGPRKGVDMRYVFLFVVVVLLGLSTDLGTTKHAVDTQLQPVIFAAVFGSS